MTITVKKYSNRRLYDTEQSRYITLEELAERIRGGVDVQVVDAKSGQDLTQATLAQIILESRGAGKLLPAALLTRLIRMGDDALAEFMGNYISWALDVYLQARRGAQAVMPYNPFASLPFQASDAFARFFGAFPGVAPPPHPEPPRAPASPEAEPAGPASPDELSELRRELEALKKAVGEKS